MTPAEMGARLRKKAREWGDMYRERDWASVPLASSGAYPKLPQRGEAPASAREALRREAAEILVGRWLLLGHFEAKVDDPPSWQRDYLAKVDLVTAERGFRLNHRALPGGADIRLVWELSRWQPLVRLAQAAWLLNENRLAEKCALWLEDWVKQNPAGRGWNWTSPLEAGLRLVQFTWLDALLAEGSERWGGEAEWDTLCYEILAPHAWFVWRHKSFGSSANNHLLGELAGLICATTRWPGLSAWGAPLPELQIHWEREVLAQFAADGGNREQALHYHLFAWELCWQAQVALKAAGRRVSAAVEQRLARAAAFFAGVQVETDPWDYGDSDDAFVTPCFPQVSPRSTPTRAWLGWLKRDPVASEMRFWWGQAPALAPGSDANTTAKDWTLFPQTGLAMSRAGDWTLRWDLSPLGYLSTAAHGHLDALHLSVWSRGVALIVDPGTGAYYSDEKLRADLASWAAHNGPQPSGLDYPRRLGTFLWSESHQPPRWHVDSPSKVSGTLELPGWKSQRSITRLEQEDGWKIADLCTPGSGVASSEFTVCWQFAPGALLESMGERVFKLIREGVALKIQLDSAWHEVQAFTPSAAADGSLTSMSVGVCAPAFRQIKVGPQLRLTGRGHPACVFRTTLLACRP